MADAVSREEFKYPEGRVSIVEGEVEGEKTLSRYILDQTRRNGDDLAAVKTRLDRVESELRSVKLDVAGLRKDLPAIASEAMRGVLRSERQT